MYQLAISDRTYSSWSLRGWLLFAGFGIPVRSTLARLYSDDFAKTMLDFAPSKLVPTLKAENGLVVWETLAIAAYLEESHPEIAFWPEDANARAMARSMVAEMHAGFSALRGACAMNVAHSWVGFESDEAVLRDLNRLMQLWALARSQKSEGEWLFGSYSVADAFFAPVAMRIAGYGLSVDDDAQAYVDAHLAQPDFRRWRAMGRAENYHQSTYDMPLEKGPWPGPVPIAAKAIEPSAEAKERCENDLCPYSQLPITDYLEIDGRVFGFCRPFCRDKTVADPAAWPDFMDIYQT